MFPETTERCKSLLVREAMSTTVPGDGLRVMVVRISKTALGNNLMSLSGRTDVMVKTAVAVAVRAAALLEICVCQGHADSPVSGQPDA